MEQAPHQRIPDFPKKYADKFFMSLRSGAALNVARLEPRWQIAWHDPSPD
jgi:hypothetical protein